MCLHRITAYIYTYNDIFDNQYIDKPPLNTGSSIHQENVIFIIFQRDLDVSTQAIFRSVKKAYTTIVNHTRLYPT